MTTGPYYNQILDIAKDYLGPAAGRFVNRQIHNYLNKEPGDLLKSDIPMLAIRIRSGLVVLTKDEETVRQAYQRITSIGN